VAALGGCREDRAFALGATLDRAGSCTSAFRARFNRKVRAQPGPQAQTDRHRNPRPPAASPAPAQLVLAYCAHFNPNTARPLYTSDMLHVSTTTRQKASQFTSGHTASRSPPHRSHPAACGYDDSPPQCIQCPLPVRRPCRHKPTTSMALRHPKTSSFLPDRRSL